MAQGKKVAVSGGFCLATVAKDASHAWFEIDARGGQKKNEKIASCAKTHKLVESREIGGARFLKKRPGGQSETDCQKRKKKEPHGLRTGGRSFGAKPVIKKKKNVETSLFQKKKRMVGV